MDRWVKIGDTMPQAENQKINEAYKSMFKIEEPKKKLNEGHTWPKGAGERGGHNQYDLRSITDVTISKRQIREWADILEKSGATVPRDESDWYDLIVNAVTAEVKST